MTSDSASRVADVVSRLRTRLEGTGRMLLGMRADGVEVSSEQIDAVMSTSALEFQRLEFITADPVTFVRELLGEAYDAFVVTMPARVDVANDLSEGRIGEGLRGLRNCLSAWSTLHESVEKSSRLLKIDLGKIDVDGQPMTSWLLEVAARLRDIRNALDAGDTVVLADILQHEIGETLEGWGRSVERLIASITPGASRP